MLPCCHLNIVPITVAALKVCSIAVGSAPNECTDVCYINVSDVRIEMLLKKEVFPDIALCHYANNIRCFRVNKY